MENKNQPAFATSTPSCKQYNGHIQEGLTKLEYFTIECFKVVGLQTEGLSVADKVTLSIHTAKELLKQLEDEN